MSSSKLNKSWHRPALPGTSKQEKVANLQWETQEAKKLKLYNKEANIAGRGIAAEEKAMKARMKKLMSAKFKNLRNMEETKSAELLESADELAGKSVHEYMYKTEHRESRPSTGKPLVGTLRERARRFSMEANARTDSKVPHTLRPQNTLQQRHGSHFVDSSAEDANYHGHHHSNRQSSILQHHSRDHHHHHLTPQIHHHSTHLHSASPHSSTTHGHHSTRSAIKLRAKDLPHGLFACLRMHDEDHDPSTSATPRGSDVAPPPEIPNPYEAGCGVLDLDTKTFFTELKHNQIKPKQVREMARYIKKFRENFTDNELRDLVNMVKPGRERGIDLFTQLQYVFGSHLRATQNIKNKMIALNIMLDVFSKECGVNYTDPAQTLQTRYLRMSKRAIEDLESKCRESGMTEMDYIHTHGQDDDIVKQVFGK